MTLALAGFLSASLRAAPQAARGKTPPNTSEQHTGAKKVTPLKDTATRTQHTLKIDGRELHYTATAGTLVLRSEEGKPQAGIFYIAYTKDGVKDEAARPVTFCFNGGPGSSAVWLQLGALGPERVVIKDNGLPYPPPYRVAQNPDSLLDISDLVFIDPVSTGFSRAVNPKEASRYHGVKGDIRSVGDFIRLYLTHYNRWGSPKFLAGESYGTTRAAGLSGYLQNRGIYLNGVVLVSSVLNFQTLAFNVGNDLPYVLYLPSYAATAWYHKKLAPGLEADFQQTVREARQFAFGEYASALLAGDSLSKAQRTDVVDKLSRFTGLSKQYIEDSNLRVPVYHFVKQLLRDQRRTVGRFDSRLEGMDRDAAGSTFSYDPSFASVNGVFTGAFNGYLRNFLNYKKDRPYTILSRKVWPWKFDADNRYLNVADTLRQAMTENPYLRVFVGCGYFDLATPFAQAQYTVDHLQLDPSLRSHIVLHYYKSGHMIYLKKPSLAKLKKDLAAFYRGCLSEPRNGAGAGR